MSIQFPKAIFSNNPWKEPALFTSAQGTSREIEGIYTKENTLSSIGGALIQNDKPQFDVPTSEVPDANNSCTITIYSLFKNLLKEDGNALLAEDGKKLSLEGNYEFQVHDVKPDGEGITELILSKHD